MRLGIKKFLTAKGYAIMSLALILAITLYLYREDEQGVWTYKVSG
jgi:hypothetical protein